jgi:CRP-like cAMP-binding protein
VNNITSTPLLDFAANAPLRKYPKGQILFYGGDTPTNVYLLKQGAIKVYDIDDKGNEKILHIIGRGGLFPAVFFFSKTDTSNTFYSTLTDCEVYVVPAASLDQELQKNIKLTLYCMRWFAEETREMLIRMSSLQKSDA